MAKDIPLKLYGGPFPRWIRDTPSRGVHAGRVVIGEEKARVFRGAVGVLNNLHPGEIDGVNARLFEAAGCGAAVLCEMRPVLPGLFGVGRGARVQRLRRAGSPGHQAAEQAWPGRPDR
jgi:hypothetical protein